MRVLRTLLLTVLVVGLLAASAYGAGHVLRERDERAQAVDTDGPAAPAATSGTTDATSPTSTPSPSPTAEETPGLHLARGDRGVQVRELQHRLFQLAWLPETTTGVVDDATVAAVRGFQAKRGLPASGVVDDRTWRRLEQMTDAPTHDQLFNVLHPGPALLARGDSGHDVRDLQARLTAISWLFGDVTGTYDAATVEAVRGFQAKREIPVTGEVDQRTLDRLHAMTGTPTTRRDVQPRPAGWPARRALHDRAGAVRGQVDEHAALGGRRQGAAHARGPVRRVRHPDPRGPLPRLLQGRRPRVAALRLVDAVLDVLLGRAGRALLLRLRRGRLRRRLARLRQHPRLRRPWPGSTSRSRVGDKVVVYWS